MEFLAVEALEVSAPFLVSVVACHHVRPRGRVEWTLCVRFSLRGIGFRKNIVHNCLECRVNGGVNTYTRSRFSSRVTIRRS
jgi:hypothetical protein